MASAALVPDSHSHVLAEFDSLDPLLSALRLDSNRLKCTCLSVSRKWLALGSSGGGLNLIQRDGWKQRLILTHKEGAISRVSCCGHDEDYVAVATSQGIVVVWELNQERRGKPERIYVSTEHRGRKVTALCWDTTVLRVFVGDHLGKVTAIKLNSSKQGKVAPAFVMFPVQIITTVDSRVVQLDYLDGKLLISSRTRSYLCDTEREKFWKIGNKERDGEYGACFFPAGRNLAGQQPLIYCARPGSRMWEVNFEGEVQSTHQFKQLLSSPPLPIIHPRLDLQYDSTQRPPQSLAFAKLLYLSEHSVLTWTDRAIYIFIPQNVQVLLWSEVRDIQDISIYKNDLFCLHHDGKVSHFSLLPVERCVERLIKRNCWDVAARVCHLFQNIIVLSKGRKVLPMDKLEHLKAQLDIVTQQESIAQLEDLMSKLEPLDSACSSRRSSISSHESFNVLDCGIYRVISRRGSQSDEDCESLHSQTLSEDDRLRELSLQQEEEQGDLDSVSHASVTVDSDRNEILLPFNIQLPFRSTSPRVSLQAMKDSVTSFVRKTTEKIGTLHMNPDIRMRQEVKEDDRLLDVPANDLAQPEEEKNEVDSHHPSCEEVSLGELKLSTAAAISKIQDPEILFDPEAMVTILCKWLPYLEKAFGHQTDSSDQDSDGDVPATSSSCNNEEGEELAMTETEGRGQTDLTKTEHPVIFRVTAPFPIEEGVRRDLSHLAMLCLEFKVFTDGKDPLPSDLDSPVCCFIQSYFFLLDLKRLKRCIALQYTGCPTVWDTYVQGLQDLTSSTPVALTIASEDLVNVIKLLSDEEPWDSPLLLAHACRMYEKFGETAIRSLTRFYPSIVPLDVMQLCRGTQRHFLAYLDSLIKSKPADQRSSLLQSLVQPESLKMDWLLLAVSHDAPQTSNTLDSEGNPRPNSHLFTWGYGPLIDLLIKLPADYETKQKMSTVCKTFGYWLGYVSLCLELGRRIEALTNIVFLDDLSLIDEVKGVIPETIDEWKLILQLAKSHDSLHYHYHDHHEHQNGTANGSSVSNGHTDWPNFITVENVALLLVKVIGTERAWPYLQEWGATESFSERYTKVCDIMKVAEKRQRALIQSMLERCEQFLWSQQA
ncbi:Hermansky-Pudlak syndrome 5 protein [Xenopus tropicalis]|uniref:Hermansky-Pudlak syndrome 5 protein homolog n=1 Tax=Xenopus tropicalis TaxID=8364 RepID=A1L0Y9_XENTR|nr:BLOC-2 complex member HPS5 [Xenopus tropicalis]AAI27309.1 LOC100036709 protein [Xenopus tropicalis]|eukprot:NP_001090726.1 Hermansky-Pudlak syndrome 5 protein [Xenopus tropicalis]